jgi:O-methyltransferase
MKSSLYIELLKKVLTDTVSDAPDARLDGKDWPERGFTMIGMRRLENLQFCVESILAEGISGDLLEAGVWKGGAAILMKAMLKERGVLDRRVWIADSFEGLPPPNPKYPLDAHDTHHLMPELAVPRYVVEENFRKFGLLDENVIFIEGWFSETLDSCGAENLALLRLDGDMYESTLTTLNALYDRVQRGGYVIVDDYGYITSCRQAVHDFLELRQLQPKIKKIDWTGVYWRKDW